MPKAKLILGDNIEKMDAMEADSIDSIVCDPPYLISFMSRHFDKKHKAEQGENEGQRMQAWHLRWAKAALRVLKPGGHLLAFGGTRTYHRLVSALEDAGFEPRDCICWWHYGSGFPKSQDISKMLDKKAGAERKVVGVKPGHADFANRTTTGHIDFKNATEGYNRPWMSDSEKREAYHQLTAPSTKDAVRWQGWGTALKPASEPIILARKPLCGTVVQNILKHGVGGINIDGCRTATTDNLNGGAYTKVGGRKVSNSLRSGSGMNVEGKTAEADFKQPTGRWPANVIFSHTSRCERVGTSKVKAGKPTPSGYDRYNAANAERGYRPGTYTKGKPPPPPTRGDADGMESVDVWDCPDDCPVAILNRQSGTLKSGTGAKSKATSKGYQANAYGKDNRPDGAGHVEYGDRGGASRFFSCFDPDPQDGFLYCAKPAGREKGDGCGDLLWAIDTASASGVRPVDREEYEFLMAQEKPGTRLTAVGNIHVSVKPLKLLRWLVRMVTPPGGTMLDPFVGSGSTCLAAHLEGFDSIGMDENGDYLLIAKARLRKNGALKVPAPPMKTQIGGYK